MKAIFDFARLLKVLGHTQRYRKKRVPMAQKGRFSKNEKSPPGIHPIDKCVKF